jgi:hypothetical protein
VRAWIYLEGRIWKKRHGMCSRHRGHERRQLHDEECHLEKRRNDPKKGREKKDERRGKRLGEEFLYSLGRDRGVSYLGKCPSRLGRSLFVCCSIVLLSYCSIALLTPHSIVRLSRVSCLAFRVSCLAFHVSCLVFQVQCLPVCSCSCSYLRQSFTV